MNSVLRELTYSSPYSGMGIRISIRTFYVMEQNSNLPVVLDPDPMSLKRSMFDGITEPITTIDFKKNPQLVQFVVLQHAISIAELQEKVMENVELQKSNEKSRNEIECLKIDLARKDESSHLNWIEIPVSMMSGYGINLLTGDISHGVGWFMVAISVIILIQLRAKDIAKLRSEKRSNDND